MIRVVPRDERFTGNLKELLEYDFWMDPKGNIAIVGECEHCYWAEDHNTPYEVLIKTGWLKKSGSYSAMMQRSQSRVSLFSLEQQVTQRQLDTLADYHAACGLEFNASSWKVM